MRTTLLACVVATTIFGSVAALCEEPEPSIQEKEKANEAETPLPVLEETIVVTASRREQSVVDTPVSVSVVDSAQIATSPAETLPDLLRGVPGVTVIQTSARDFNLRSRGATTVAENNQLVMVDGRSVYLDFYGVVLWDFLPVGPDDVRRIEVQRGPGSAIWGANALAGVVNVLTKSPREMQGGLLTLTAGELDTLAASFRLGGESGALSYKISGGTFEQDAWTRNDRLPNGDPIPRAYLFPNSGTEQTKLDIRADYDSPDGALWSFKTGYGDTSGIFHSRLGPFEIENGSNVAYGEVDYGTNDLDARVYWNRLRGDAANLLNGLPFDFDVDTYVADASQRRPVGDHHLLVYGGSIRRNEFDLSLAPLGDSRNDMGVFAEDLIALGSKTTVSVGARVDYFDTIGTAISPRTGIVYRINPDHSVRFAYNRAYRAPTLVDNYLSTNVPNAYVLQNPPRPFFYFTKAEGNENLDEELVDAFEVGYTAMFRHGMATVAIYQNSVRNNIVFVPVEYFSASDPPPRWPVDPSEVPAATLVKRFGFRNIGNVRDRGVEVSAQMQFGAVSTSASYTYQHEPDVSDAQGVTFNVPPEHQASAAAWIDKGRTYGSLSVTYTGEAFWADVLDSRFWGTTEAFTLVNVGIGVRSESAKYELAVDVTNAFDERVQQHAFGDIIGRKASVTVRRRFGAAR